MRFGKRIRKGFRRVGKVTKDVATSTTRIVTDTAIDIGNVATGFQFEDEMATAKRKLSEAGIRSAAEAIESNRYGFLKDMEAQARAKVDALYERIGAGQRLEVEREQRVTDLFDMLAQASLLAQMSLEAEALVGRAADIPEWQRRHIDLDGAKATLGALSVSAGQWEHISDLVIASGVAGVTSAAAGLGSSKALAHAGKLAKAAKVARGAKAARLSGAASKFVAIGKLAGRASGVLALATVGLDIGMTFAALEHRKDELARQLRELDRGLADADEQLAAMRRELRDIEARIQQLLASVDPVQTEATWDDWVAVTEDALRRLRNQLTSLESIEDKARQLAHRTRGRGYGPHRIAYVASVDLSISYEQARAIIAAADAEANIDAEPKPQH